MFNIKKIHSYHIISVTEIEENKQVLKYTEDDIQSLTKQVRKRGK